MSGRNFILMILLSPALVRCAPAGAPGDFPAPQDNGSASIAEPLPPPAPENAPVWRTLAKPAQSSTAADTEALCRLLGRRAKDFSIGRLVIAFEGLASFDTTGVRAAYDLFERDRNFSASTQIARGSAGYVLHGVLKPLLAQARGRIEFLSLPHDAQGAGHGSVAETCVVEWLKVAPATKITIIGHSYGGHAANQLASALDDLNVPVDSVFTLDPRLRFYAGSFQRTRNAALWENYYQTNTPLLNGYVVPDADLNMNLSATGVGHTGLPFAAKVTTRIFDYML
jgi:hypothetical protein